MTISRVKPGQQLGIRPLNDVIAATNRVTLGLGAAFPGFGQSGIPLLGINKTDQTLRVGDCAAIIYDEATPYRETPTKMEGENSVIRLRLPEEGDNCNFVICGASIEPNQPGLVYAAGIILARLQQGEGSDDQYEFADVDLADGGTPWILKMKPEGAAKVLDIITDTNEPEVDWALIRFPYTSEIGTTERPYIVNRENLEDGFPIDEEDEADTDQYWNRTDPVNTQAQFPGASGPTDGVRIAICCRVIYDPDDAQVLNAYYRDLVFDSLGRIIEISEETKVIIDTPEDC